MHEPPAAGSDRLRQYLADAAASLDDGEPDDAAQRAALAVELALVATADAVVGPMPNLPALVLHTIADASPSGADPQVSVDVGAIRDAIGQLRDTTVALALGLRLREFKEFRQLAPRIVAVNGDGSWAFEYPAERDGYTPDEAERLVRAAPLLVDAIERAAARWN